MHDRAGQRAVGAGLEQDGQVGLLHGAVHVDVDRCDLSAAFFARAHRVRHHVDLGVDRIGAPDHHQVGLSHFARIDAGDTPDAGGKAGIGRIDADSGMEVRIFFGVSQPVDAVAHHQAHGAGIVIRPYCFGAVLALGSVEFLGDELERVVPGDLAKLARASIAAPPHTSTAKRSSKARMTALPAITIGILTASPRMSSAYRPLATPATAITLSRLMMMSAITTMRTARHRSATAFGVSSASCACGASSLTAIQNSASAPASRRYGSVISIETTPVNTINSREANPAPIIMPHSRSRGGRPRQASAITTALSPDKRILTQTT